MARKPEPKPTAPAHRGTDDPDELEVEEGPDGPAPVDPMAPGKSLFDDDETAVEPNEPA